MFDRLSPDRSELSQPTVEVLELHQVAYDFHREARYREEFERYCQWYYQTAERHRQELQAMQRDINLFSWFTKRR